jgi:hypothetical protein
MSAKRLSVFLSREFSVSAINGLKVSFLKQAKSSFKDLPIRQSRIKGNFFATRQLGHDYRYSAGNSPSIVDLVDETTLFELPHDAIIDNVLDSQ